ncbi:MAG: efflux RND transporter periplasmic adaptor subunit [Kiloniellaceae bacterium]
MKRSYLIAGLLAVAAAGWIASGQFDRGERPRQGQKPPADVSAAENVPTVRVRSQRAEPRTAQATLRGRTEADRKVEVKAQTHGRVVELAAAKGDRVKAGDVLVRLSDEDRPARLAEAKALREQRRIEYRAALRLSKKGFRAETQVVAAKAELEAAEAAVAAAEVELANLVLRAPFDGIVSNRYVEIGDFVEIGDPVARIVDLDPILVTAQASERDVGRLSVGAPSRIRLITGEELEGRVRYIASEADPATRTFRVEVEVPNPQAAVPDGVTAELVLPLERIVAHHISPAILTLSDDGVIGVKTLGPANRVEFKPVRIVGEAADGVWVTGLPERVTLITVGQEFVTAGQSVRPIDERTLAPYGAGDAS